MNPHDAPPFFRGGPISLEHHGGPGTLGWTIFALQLLMLAALATLLARAFALPAGRGRGLIARRKRHSVHDPVADLRMRYARGDISRDEYLQATRDLGGEAEGPTEELPPN